RLHPPWQTRGKRVHRVVQRATTGRMFERGAVHLGGRRPSEDRSVARRLQSAPATRLARPPDADRVHRATSGDTGRRRGRFFSLRTVSLRGQRQRWPFEGWLYLAVV